MRAIKLPQSLVKLSQISPDFICSSVQLANYKLNSSPVYYHVVATFWYHLNNCHKFLFVAANANPVLLLFFSSGFTIILFLEDSPLIRGGKKRKKTIVMDQCASAIPIKKVKAEMGSILNKINWTKVWKEMVLEGGPKRRGFHFSRVGWLLTRTPFFEPVALCIYSAETTKSLMEIYLGRVFFARKVNFFYVPFKWALL